MLPEPCGWPLNQSINKALNIEPIRGQLKPRAAQESTDREKGGVVWSEKGKKGD